MKVNLINMKLLSVDLKKQWILYMSAHVLLNLLNKFYAMSLINSGAGMLECYNQWHNLKSIL